MSTDTPRTNEHTSTIRSDMGTEEIVPADFARSLERDLTAAREQSAELDGTVRTLATVQTQLIAERDAARARVVEIDAENGALKAKLVESRTRVAELEVFAFKLATYPRTRGDERSMESIRKEARALLSPSPEPTK